MDGSILGLSRDLWRESGLFGRSDDGWECAVTLAITGRNASGPGLGLFGHRDFGRLFSVKI